jgi:predicted nucleic acid-binding protein
MFLLDTNVVSEFRRPRPHGAVITWAEQVPDEQLHLSAVTLGELQAGIEITRERDPQRAAEIGIWVDRVAELYRILPVDGRIFRVWAKLMHRQPLDLGLDGLIAATAVVHDLTVVTRNVRDFQRFSVTVLDPWKASAQ